MKYTPVEMACKTRMGSIESGVESGLPLYVSTDARADIRMRSSIHDPAHVGDPGGLWILYKPHRAIMDHSQAKQCND